MSGRSKLEVRRRRVRVVVLLVMLLGLLAPLLVVL